MTTQLIAAIFVSLWLVLMLKLYRRAARLQSVAALRRAHPHSTAEPGRPMAVRVKMSHI